MEEGEERRGGTCEVQSNKLSVKAKPEWNRGEVGGHIAQLIYQSLEGETVLKNLIITEEDTEKQQQTVSKGQREGVKNWKGAFARS